ncbi:hydroxyisourate hydrolase [Streptomyces sp. 8N706]|uniref:hydroxyisourate hydrolase n=1 Tax=Streptomyces sp. 8N706 TaxID=3457416 RepID=UPI003FCF200A
MSNGSTASVSTHILDTSIGRPAGGVAVRLSVRGAGTSGGDAGWSAHGTSRTDDDGRCKDLPALPEGTSHARLFFDVGPYFARRDSHDRPAGGRQEAPRAPAGGAFFPEVAIVFAVEPGEHYHVPLLLNPFGYSVYRGS